MTLNTSLNTETIMRGNGTKRAMIASRKRKRTVASTVVRHRQGPVAGNALLVLQVEDRGVRHTVVGANRIVYVNVKLELLATYTRKTHRKSCILSSDVRVLADVEHWGVV